MSTIFRRRPDPAPATGDLIRIRILERLNQYLDRGITHVPVAEMLDLLDPNHVPPAPDKPDPRADPITGAMPVLPEAYQKSPPL